MNIQDRILLKYLIKSLLKYYIENKYNVLPLPKIYLDFKKRNKNPILLPTGKYDRDDFVIILFCYGRHIKDILRSLSHEMIHHQQNLDGKLKFKVTTTNIHEDERILELEKDAYMNGNIIFRSWTTDEENK